MKNFIERWLNHGDEKSDTQKFWLEFLEKICGVKNPGELIEFEKRVELVHKSFIDAYILKTRVIIEQKSFGFELDKFEKQSDGSFMTPFEQAKRYSDWLPDSERARWIITCNFQEIRVYDMERPKAPPEIIRLENLEKEYRKFQFLVDVKGATPRDIREEEISIKAGELAGKLYDALRPCYKDPDSPATLKSLNILCVRIVFLLYAEDSEIFVKGQFHNYVKKYVDKNPRQALIDLFNLLALDIDERKNIYIDDPDLAAFPYVDGGLFREKNIEIPNLNGEPLRIILEDMSEGFDWSEINCAIFGAIFESTLNGRTRRSGGMHYTTIRNIHKVIDPLFLDELEDEFNKTRSREKLKVFRKKLSSLRFFDPACGSGNFLTEAYKSLCRLEIRVIEKLNEFPILNVSIGQFFGIEINDFAVAVAKTALWIASIQMTKECNSNANLQEKCLPLQDFNNLFEDNALTLDWAEVIAPRRLSYIMGNPPFAGARVMLPEQKSELNQVFKGWKNLGNLDYVSCWYKKAADFMKKNKKIKAALVSTNSITQGDGVAILWKPLFAQGIHFDFAWRTFKWDSELKKKAHVHCVIIGFSYGKVPETRKIFTAAYPDENDENREIFEFIVVKNINAYLIDAPENIFVEARREPLCDCEPLVYGNSPIDDGNYTVSEDEYETLISREPKIKKYFRMFIGAQEFINGKKRYCIWLKDADLKEVRKSAILMERISNVQKWRSRSGRKGTLEAADTPMLFAEIRQPDSDYMAIPITSSERRRYIPVSYMPKDIIVGNSLLVLPDATLYDFGILVSRVHMAWLKSVGGRLKSDYRYSNTVVYNNFVWPDVNAKQRAKIEKTAQKILDVREKFPGSTLADLYDPLTMPPELLRAHKENDAAVCEAYEWDKNISEEEIVSELMKLYEKMAE